VQSIIANPVFGGNTCAQCQALLEVLKFLSLAAPERGPDLVVVLCGVLKLSSTCEATFGRHGTGMGAVITQVVANADVGGYDGQVGDQCIPNVSLGCITVACRPFVKISSTRAPLLRPLP
jgi:hypothetical protein